MRQVRFLSMFFICSILASCAGRVKQNDSKSEARQLTPKELERLQFNAKDEISKKLDIMSDMAKQKGPEMVIYLATDFYLKASAAMLEGDYQTANLIFARLIKLIPDDYYLKRKYALSLIRTGELAKARELFKELFQGKKKEVTDGLILGGIYSGLGELKEARTVYQQVLKLDPQNEDACVFLGKSYAVEDKPQEAIKIFKNCENKIKNKGIFAYYTAKLWIDKNDLKKAKIYLKKAIKIEPEMTEALMALGLVYEEEKNFKQAEQIYTSYLKKAPDSQVILTRLVQLYFTQEEYGKVIPYAEKLSDLEPDNLNLKIKLGILYTDNKRFPEAINVFKELLVHAPDNDKILYYIAAIYQEMGNYEYSIDFYSKIGTESGLYHDSIVQMANMLSLLATGERVLLDKNQVRWEKRFKNFMDEKIASVEALKLQLLVIKSNYFEGVEEYSTAASVMEQVIVLKEAGAQHKYFLAAIYEKIKNYNRSAELIFEILEKEPENAHAWNFIGYSMLEQGIKFDLAKEYILRALSLRPNDAYIRDSLGWYYYKIGEKELALKELLFATSKVKDDVSILKHLAVVYTSLNRLDQATFWVKKAMDNVTDPRERSELELVLQSLKSNRVPANFLSK